ncbi:MAG: error-prone DNA polymerase [Verrucomicrobia bacterium]|nr:error-prone DNA polymerase [Verrucomicrobiota bacterium]
MSSYVELHARSAFSFLRGGSQPSTLAERATSLELPALALLDRMGVYGAPRFSSAARDAGLHPIFGAELVLDDGGVLPVLVENRTGYQNLCRLLTRAHLRAPKGEGVVRWEELPEFSAGLIALTGDEEGPLRRSLLGARTAPAGREQAASTLDRLQQTFGAEQVFVELQRHHQRGEERINQALTDLAQSRRLPLLATNGVSYAAPEGRQVSDVFTCLRHHTTLDGAGRLLSVNAERHLKSPAQMTALFADLPEALRHTVRLSERLRFELSDLGYEFPKFPVGPGETMEGVLKEWTYRGAHQRYGPKIPDKVSRLLVKELALIQKLGFAGYFLIVADLVRYCREHDILAQGRGSAANSAVCFCLGITAVDPVRFEVLFERFLSESRKGWPDIDIDLPSGDRREQVIQEVYRRYGPHGAAMTGAVSTYRGRSTAREIGKVLGLPVDLLDRFSALFASGDFPHTLELIGQLERSGLPAAHPRAPAFVSLYQQISGLPRHLGQHSGGMIICQDQLHRFVPLENAAMPGRVVAQWDKDDCEDLGIIKIDLLGLGMMAALQEMVRLCELRQRPVDLANLPENDPQTYEMIRRADTIGVFQIESRAQMATLPRMKPAKFYDLVIEVAIIRPGPIQGGLAHPFLARRNGEEPVTYFGGEERLKPILERTLGVPLFQEQMLAMAMVMANFSGSEAEELRRALSFHRSDEKMARATAKLRAAMARSGVSDAVAEQIVGAVGSFALYGFPESHAISFAHLAYASSYLKAHRAPEFFCALLNNQPMGFYSPATLIRDAKAHGVPVRPVCAVQSDWDCQLEADSSLRLGFRQVEGLRREAVAQLISERERAPFRSLEDFKRRTRLRQEELRRLASIGAFRAFSPHRRAALWEAERRHFDDLLDSAPTTTTTAPAPLAPMSPFERLNADYGSLRLSTGPHPMALVRDRFPDLWRATDLTLARDRECVRVGGQVICRQRPGTAKGICFVSLEDETGITNAIVSSDLFEQERLTITQEPFLMIEGDVQNREGTIHVKARRIERLDYGPLAASASHDFG